MSTYADDVAGLVGGTVAEALRRLQPELEPEGPAPAARGTGWLARLARLARLFSEPLILPGLHRARADGVTPGWGRGAESQTVEQALERALEQSPAVEEPAWRAPDGPAPEHLLAARLARLWKPLAVLVGAVGLVVLVGAFHALGPRAPRPRTAQATAPSADGVHLAELAGEVGARCVTWKQELRDAEELIASANLEPVRLTLSADDVFAGARRRPRLLIEGKLADAEVESPLRQPVRGRLARDGRAGSRYLARASPRIPLASASGVEPARCGLTVRTSLDRPVNGSGEVMRVIEGSW